MTRLDQAWHDLSHEQLIWRPYEGAHSIYEILVHVAGAQHYWASRLSFQNPSATAEWAKLDSAVRSGFLREGECPYSDRDMSPSFARHLLEETSARLRPILEKPTPEQLNMPLESPLGPMTDGSGGLVRIAQHAAYHTGQIWLMRLDPNFP